MNKNVQTRKITVENEHQNSYNLVCTAYGGIAQLGERLNGIQEVSGSIPLISTRKSLETLVFQGFFHVCYFIIVPNRAARDRDFAHHRLWLRKSNPQR